MATSRKVIKGISKIAGLGWAKEAPSIKDWKLHMHPKLELKPIDQLPNESKDRRALNLNAPIMDQGQLGSCVGCSVGHNAVGYLRRTDRDKYDTVHSALQMYYDARVADGEQWKDVDSGAYIRDAVDCLRKIGLAPESKWRYNINNFAKKPTASVYKAAATWKAGASWKCDTIEQVLNAIDAGFAVVGGIVCYSSMFTAEVDRTGRIPMPKRTDDIEGGHALYFDRYVISDRLLRCENSWGPNTGDGGYYYLPFDYAANKELSDDWWAIEREAPETTPWKD